jgi:hypothetical protein
VSEMDYKRVAKKIENDLNRHRNQNKSEDSELTYALNEIEKIRHLPVAQLEVLLVQTEATQAVPVIFHGIDYGEPLKKATILDLKSWIYEAKHPRKED